MAKHSLNETIEIYSNDPYESENKITISNYIEKCIAYSRDRSAYLELGIGHGIAIRRLSEAMRRVVVVEGASELVEQYRGMYPNVEINHGYFEHFDTDETFAQIGMGFVLEHVDDPVVILQRYRKFLATDGSIFVNVPNAASLHRLLAINAGLLDRLDRMSETDRRHGHQRFLRFDEWKALFEGQGFTIARAEGLYLKPFTTQQIERAGLPTEVYRALAEVAASYPDISNSCFFELRAD
ncbi:MAG: class I SAM-dependent methyltransferase [Solirubrobacterales bacterium]